MSWLSRYAGRYGERGDLRCGGRDRQSGWGGVGAARRALPRGGPFAGEAGAGVRQDGARGDLSGRFERGARGGRGGARGGHDHLLRGAAVPRAPSASRADADHGGGGEVGGGGAAGAAVERLRLRRAAHFARGGNACARAAHTLGHATGDALLIAVAERLRGALRPQDTAARLGGDEFAILVENILSISGMEIVATRVLEAMGREFDVCGHTLHASTSIGVAIAGPEHADRKS